MTKQNIIEARKKMCLDLKQIAIDKNLTHQQIADLTGFKSPNVTRLLNGKVSPTLDNLIKIAGSLEIKIILKKY